MKFFVVLLLTLFFSSVSPISSAANCFSEPEENINIVSKQDIDLKLIQQQKSFEKIQAKNRAACLITTEQLKKIPASRLLVDVRQTTQAKKIPLTNINIVNIPLRMLEHKQYLKDKAIIITPVGAELRRLLIACGKLRQKGYKQTYVLKDGVHALQAISKNRIMPADKRGLISAKRLFIERFERDWKIVYVGKGERGRIDQYFKVTNIKKNPTRTIKRLSKQKDTSKNPVGIIVMDMDGSGYPAIKKQLNKIKLPVIYFLEGGAQSFNDFIHKQYLQTAKSEFVLQEPQRCK